MSAKGEEFSNLRLDQQATLFPSLGYFDLERKCWRAMVHGRVSMSGPVSLSRLLLLKGLKRVLSIASEEPHSDTFQRRIDGFLAAPGRRKRIVLEIADHRYRLHRRSRRNGAFWGVLNLESYQSTALHSQVETMQVCLPPNDLADREQTLGQLHVVQPQGVSVISDIDDTIKLTETTCRRQMLANTFLHPFAAVEGMPELYQSWQRAGCDFHYVSRSPWELYGPLSELCTSSGFPAGSMHLRYFRVRDEVLRKFRPVRRSAKVGIVIDLLERMPERRFVLVGDSGEIDPEVYRLLARRFPHQIAAILIRELSSATMSVKRLRKLESLPKTTQVLTFQRPEEIQEIVPTLLRKAES